MSKLHFVFGGRVKDPRGLDFDLSTIDMVGLFPDFACLTDLRRRKLVTVLEPDGIDVGAVWLAYPVQRYLASRVREFIDLAVDRLAREAPWVSRHT